MENMTWVEIDKAIKNVPMIIVPLGARQKEHGYHLPMNTDYLMAEYFRDQLLEKFSIMSTSPIDINFFPAFTEYPGSEHLTLDNAIELVYQKCKSHVNHGITHIYVINMGISTNKVLKKVQERFKNEGIVFQYTDQKKFDNSPTIKKQETQQRGTHADELETSMMLYIKPEVVKMEKAIKDDNDEMNPNHPGPLTRNPNATMGIFSASGAWGDPTLATAAKGKIIVQEYNRLLEQEVGLMLADCLRQKSNTSTRLAK
jgi:creatinine amidohydrolase